jgi:hypothetical protein
MQFPARSFLVPYFSLLLQLQPRSSSAYNVRLRTRECKQYLVECAAYANLCTLRRVLLRRFRAYELIAII